MNTTIEQRVQIENAIMRSFGKSEALENIMDVIASWPTPPPASFSAQVADLGAEERNLDSPHFDGVAVEPEKDQERLTKGILAVFNAMHGRGWLTIQEIAERAGVPENSASAHFRSLRKKRWGAHRVARVRSNDKGLFRYCLFPNHNSLTYQNWVKDHMSISLPAAHAHA